MKMYNILHIYRENRGDDQSTQRGRNGQMGKSGVYVETVGQQQHQPLLGQVVQRRVRVLQLHAGQ